MTKINYPPHSSHAQLHAKIMAVCNTEVFYGKQEDLHHLMNIENSNIRTTFPMHFTTSAIVFHPSGMSILLVKHKKYQKWVYPGGHADGDWNFLNSALREVQEETGLCAVTGNCADGLPAFFAKFEIPALEREPAHQHLDATFLFWAEQNFEIKISAESTDMRWFALSDFADNNQEIPPETLFLCQQGIRMSKNIDRVDRLSTKR